MKKIITLLLFCGAYCCLMAQSEAETKAQINKIKRSLSYLSAEATMPTEEEAIQQAKELLVSEINDWVAGKRKGDEVKQVVLQDINTCTQRMDMKRGVRTRAFVYVKKKDIVLIYGEGQIMLSEEEKGSDLQALSEISEPIKIEPAKKPSKEEKMTSTVEKINPVQEGLNQILAARNMTDMKQVFATLKAQGSISYGVYSPANVAEQCYLLFYTRTGDVKGVVKKNGNELNDVRTKVATDVASFSGCGAYWFILK